MSGRKSKNKGATFERSIRAWLGEREKTVDPAPRGYGGSDVWLPELDAVLECKNQAQLRLSEWWNQAKTDAEEMGAATVGVCHKRHRVGDAGEQWVTLTLSEWLLLVQRAHFRNEQWRVDS